jgi:hypothetical protein
MIAKKPQTETQKRKKAAKNKKINVKYELKHKFAERKEAGRLVSKLCCTV